MKQQLICLVDEQWFGLGRAGEIVVLDEQQVVDRPTQLLADFPDATIGLYRAEVEKRFALPTIEKRLRSEGLIEGESRLIPHWSHSVSGTTSCFLTAVALRDWQMLGDWARRQAYPVQTHALGQLLLVLARRHGCVLVRWGRQMHFAAWHRGEMAHESVTAYQEEQEALNSALDSLLSRVERDQLGRAVTEAERIHWFDLFAMTLAVDGEDAEAHAASLRGRMSDRLGREVLPAGRPVVQRLPGQAVESEPEVEPASDTPSDDLSLEFVEESAGPEVQWRYLRVDRSLGRMLARTPTLEPPLLRVADFAERLRLPLAAASLVASVGLGGLAWQNLQEAERMQTRASVLEAEAARISADMPAQPPPGALLDDLAEDLALVDELAEARRGASPGEVFLDLQEALRDARIRIMRVAAADGGRSYRIEGMFEAGADADLTRFISRLAGFGYDVEALDPGSRSRGTGFFSYRLSKETTT
ncbi:MAG: hypothetical protein ACOC00_03105 [Halothiobacillaceae bacterium]